jgi:hypothetical protein
MALLSLNGMGEGMIANKTLSVVSLPNNFTVIVREGEGRIENKT